MRFNIPCFVHVRDVEQRRRLVEWCKAIGYTEKYDSAKENLLVIVNLMEGQVDGALDCDEIVYTMLGWGLIDCETDIEKFKALAALNDENDMEQWFTNGIYWYIYRCTLPSKGYEHWGDTEGIEFSGMPVSLNMENYHKATASEIIAHFNKYGPR